MLSSPPSIRLSSRFLYQKMSRLRPSEEEKSLFRLRDIKSVLTCRSPEIICRIRSRKKGEPATRCISSRAFDNEIRDHNKFSRTLKRASRRERKEVKLTDRKREIGPLHVTATCVDARCVCPNKSFEINNIKLHFYHRWQTTIERRCSYKIQNRLGLVTTRRHLNNHHIRYPNLILFCSPQTTLADKASKKFPFSPFDKRAPNE